MIKNEHCKCSKGISLDGVCLSCNKTCAFGISDNLNPICPECHFPKHNDGKNTDASVCICDKKPIGLQGWICPVCGSGMSPYTQKCGCKSEYPYGTWTGGKVFKSYQGS